ncbi:hypothetical protein [Streptomyces sp. NPDC127033]|uniref:hypothetical protein n=1 Tax=Streptomyces sp. NPDC127033 TaxID=3347110 RepID=UPI00365B97CE
MVSPLQRHGAAAAAPAEVVRAGRPPGVLTICLPLDYTAFCTLHQDSYLRYAYARIADLEEARAVVRTALGELALVWPSALRSSCPQAVAWQLLGRLVSAAQVRSGAASRDRSVHRILPAGPADALLLCHGLSLTARQAAALMGEEEPTVRSQLSAALRCLSESGAAADVLLRGAVFSRA